jgi:predicted transcriptional regulator
MEQLCDLLFELSSGERMNIMLSLLQERLKLSHVSQRLDMTVTEASRHLQRLSDIQLVSKDIDGTFGPTPYGELAVSLLPSLDFISENRQYFLEHVVSNIPYEFTNRLGELSTSSFEMDAVKVLAHCYEILHDAEDYIWTQSYQILPNHVPIILDQIGNGVIFRGIFPEVIDLHPTILPVVRTRRHVELRILASEKEAMTGFAHRTGEPHYSAFFSEDPKFIKWCKDVHHYYWESSKPATISQKQ